MPITYRSTIAQTFVLMGTDEYGREDWAWQLRLEHPDGSYWTATHTGTAGILDSMSELLNSRNNEYVTGRANGDRQRTMQPDRNRAVDEGGNSLAANIIPRWDR
jgi:hypothetical protein